MAANAMNKAFTVALLMLLGAMTGCSRPVEEPPLAGAQIGGPFTLTDQDGRRRSNTEFDGKYRMIYFGYTFCPDVCPLDMQHLMQGLKLFEKRDSARAALIQPIFISVDPKRDTSPVLKQWVTAFHPRLIGLTGTETEIAAVAKEYAIYYKVNPPAEGSQGYLVDHARQTILFGKDGKPLALISQDLDAEHIASELDRWTR
jgi:protein SCO1/2